MSGHAKLIPLDHINTTWQKPKEIGYQTKAWHHNGDWSIRFYRTDICSYDAQSQTLFVITGGYRSAVTAHRIRHGLAVLGLQLLITDLPGRWRIADYEGNAWSIRGDRIKLTRCNCCNGGWHRCVNT